MEARTYSVTALTAPPLIILIRVLYLRTIRFVATG